MDALLLDALHRQIFVLLAVVGACWLTVRACLFVRDVLLWLMELFIEDEIEEIKRPLFTKTWWLRGKKWSR